MDIVFADIRRFSRIFNDIHKNSKIFYYFQDILGVFMDFQ